MDYPMPETCLAHTFVACSKGTLQSGLAAGSIYGPGEWMFSLYQFVFVRSLCDLVSHNSLSMTLAEADVDMLMWDAGTYPFH